MAICINSSEYKTAACIDIHCEIQAVMGLLSQMLKALTCFAWLWRS